LGADFSEEKEHLKKLRNQDRIPRPDVTVVDAARR
jgi:hypothetical protein